MAPGGSRWWRIWLRRSSYAPWHDVNFPKSSCTYLAERDCPDGQCVVAAIDRQTVILAAVGSDASRLRALDQDTEVMTARLLANGAGVSSLAPAHGAVATSTAVQAAEESCRIVGLPGFYPGRLVDLTYVQRFTPVMEQRLQQAGARLAGVLNQALPVSGAMLP